MNHGEAIAAGKAVPKLGGLVKSPLQDQSQVWEAFAAIANGIDPEEPIDSLILQGMREFIQLCWFLEGRK